jgi:hypothetical protein
MVIRKKVKGVVEFNDGDFAEVQTVGIEGIEKNLLLWKIQLHRENTNDSRPEFQHRFPVKTWVNIWTTVEVGAQLRPSSETLWTWPFDSAVKRMR